MPGTTRRQKWRSVAVHFGILLAIVITIRLLIAIPTFLYIAAAVALGAAGYGVYRFARGSATSPKSIYRWGIHAGYAVVFVGAVIRSASDPVPATSTGQRLPPASPQRDIATNSLAVWSSSTPD